jgi:hypothetical protein
MNIWLPAIFVTTGWGAAGIWYGAHHLRRIRALLEGGWQTRPVVDPEYHPVSWPR